MSSRSTGPGSPFTDIIRGTLLQDVQNGTRYHTSTFCGTCEDELRNNENYLAKASYFLSSKELGSHTIVAGYDHYNDIRNANNHQSGSDYRVQGTTTYIRDGVIYPVWNNVGSSTVFQYNPIAQLAQDTAFVTYGIFLNDSWQVTNRLTANLGLRYDKNNGKNSAGVTTANDSAWSPRLGVVYDVTGKGDLRVNFYYGKYVQAIANNIADGTSAAGQPQTFRYQYNGPAINVGVNDQTPLSQLDHARCGDPEHLRLVQHEPRRRHAQVRVRAQHPGPHGRHQRHADLAQRRGVHGGRERQHRQARRFPGGRGVPQVQQLLLFAHRHDHGDRLGSVRTAVRLRAHGEHERREPQVRRAQHASQLPRDRPPPFRRELDVVPRLRQLRRRDEQQRANLVDDPQLSRVLRPGVEPAQRGSSDRPAAQGAALWHL